MDIGRDRLANDASLVGRDLCRAYAASADEFLTSLFVEADADRPGVALLALGGYGRSELSLQSDLDVLLLHDDTPGIAEIADAVWYPVWDAGIKLGHAVRTPKEALGLAAEDLDTATALLQGRHLVGDADLTERLLSRGADQWAKRAKRLLPLLSERVEERHTAAGEVAFLLEPDLKEGRGGLRDVQSMRWAAAARPMLWDERDPAIDAAYDTLLGARVELHRRTGRPGDRLLLQEQDAVAAALGDANADELMRRVADAARTIAFRSDDTWRRIDSALRGPLGRIAKRDRKLDDLTVLRDGAVHLTAAADSATSPGLPIHVVALAAAEQAHVHRSALESLQAAPSVPTPWSQQIRDDFVRLLGAGRSAIAYMESLDQHGLLTKLLPEWEAVQSKPQRNAYHTYTVDRHLCEAAANAAELASRVTRVDLLLVGTLLHDIGKGFPGDHTEVGVKLIADIGQRMGFAAADVDTLVAMCELHLLLPDIATRRDLDDPAIIDRVASEVGTVERLHLLHALTEADSLATGPAAWGQWKADLVRQLVRRVEHVLGGGEVDEITIDFPSDEHRALVAKGERQLIGDGQTLTVIAEDRSGLFARVSGVLALHGLDVLDANVGSIDGWALEVFRVQSSFGPTFSWDKVLADLERALDGRLAIKARLAERRATYQRATVGKKREPTVEFHPEDSDHATVVEITAPDSVGILHQITATLADFDLDIVRSRVQTLGQDVVDTFYVRDANGDKLAEELWPELRRAVTHAIDDV